MSFEYYYDGVSIQNGRNTNMDSLILKNRRVEEDVIYLAAVCDGVGSLEAGGLASSWSISMLSNWFENLEDTEDIGSRLREYIETVNEAVTLRAQKQNVKTACTLSCILIVNNKYYVVHLGDSRIYSCFDGDLFLLTLDHSKDGKLTSVVGHRMDTEIFYAEGECTDNHTFLICSDGLYKRMDNNLLEENVKDITSHNIDKKIQTMLDFVIERGEKDNISVAILTNIH